MRHFWDIFKHCDLHSKPSFFLSFVESFACLELGVWATWITGLLSLVFLRKISAFKAAFEGSDWGGLLLCRPPSALNFPIVQSWPSLIDSKLSWTAIWSWYLTREKSRNLIHRKIYWMTINQPSILWQKMLV